MGELTDYIAGLDGPAGALIERYRQRAMVLVPEAEQGRSYGMAALRYRDRPLISVVQTKQGFSVYPFSAAVVESVTAELDGFEATKGGIKFTDQHPLPDPVFDTLVTRRRAEIEATPAPRRR